MSLPEFYNSISFSYEYIKTQLLDAMGNRKNGLRTMQLCYIKGETPFCRTVVLRHCAPDLSSLHCHSDYRSPKVKAMMSKPNVSIHFYDPALKIQLSMNGMSEIQYKNAITEASWEKTQTLSRRCYLSRNAPSDLLKEPNAGFAEKFENNTQTKEETEIGYDNFCVIKTYIHQIDYLYLHKLGNRRILFQKDAHNEFAGQWLAP